MKLRWLITATLLLLLAACSGETPPPSEPAATAPEAAGSPAPLADPDAMESAAEQASDAVEAAAEVVEESAAETSDSTAAMADAVAPAQAETGEAKNWRFSSGAHYSQLTAAQGTADLAGGIEVAEVFWYGCPHCFNFDPYIAKWEEQLPENVKVTRLPVMWNPTNEIHARMFYTAEALGKLEQMHPAFFRALHLERKTLTREDDIRDFFADFGVDGATFDKTFRSFAVESKLKRAKGLTARYRITSVPVLVVNGKYLTDGPEIKSFDDMLAVAQELVEKESQAL